MPYTFVQTYRTLHMAIRIRRTRHVSIELRANILDSIQVHTDGQENLIRLT